MAFSKALIGTLVLALVASSSAAGGRSLLSPGELLDHAQVILGGAASQVETGLQRIVGDLFGAQNTFATQIPANIDSLSWNSLQNLDFTSPVSDFVDSIRNKTLVKDVLEAEDKVSDFIDHFCDPAEFDESEKVPSNCVGKQLIVRLAPWECKLYDNKTVSCTPAYIEVIKRPANCTAKYESAATFTGKECKLQKKIGDELTKTIGGDSFSVDISKNLLDIPHQIATSLLPGEFDTPAAIGAPLDASAAASDGTNAAAAASAIATAGRR